MNNRVTLKILPFKNPSGNVVHRVTGTIYGERVQKNFASLSEARGFMNGLIQSANQGDSLPTRVAYTTLAKDEELREAELAWARLRASHPTGSLITVVDYYLANAGQVIRDADAHDVLEDYLTRRLERGNKAKTVEICRSILKQLFRSQCIKNISELTPARATTWVYGDSATNRTRRDRHGQLHTFGEFLVKQRYLSKNLAVEIDRPKVTYDGKVTTLTPAQVLALLRGTISTPVGKKNEVGVMLAYFAVSSLSGVRPDEARRLGHDWLWFSKQNRIITGFRSKTSNRPRTVEISENLVEILEHCRLMGFAPSDFSRKAFDKIRAAVGVLELWDNDILRHTYASCHYAVQRDIGWLQKNMGNSEDVLNRSYLDQTILAEQGRALFDITLSGIISGS